MSELRKEQSIHCLRLRKKLARITKNKLKKNPDFFDSETFLLIFEIAKSVELFLTCQKFLCHFPLFEVWVWNGYFCIKGFRKIVKKG